MIVVWVFLEEIYLVIEKDGKFWVWDFISMMLNEFVNKFLKVFWLKWIIFYCELSFC